MKTIGIIPARYHSSRFPGKVLAEINGKSIIQHVYEKVSYADFDEVVVATDQKDIAQHVKGFGCQTVMTSEDLASGTERCAQALSSLQDSFDLVVNIQSDEPFIKPDQLNALMKAFSDQKTEIATLIQAIDDPDDLFSPNVVKVVKDQQNTAKLFSRTSIPYLRDVKLPEWLTYHRFFSHLGIYAYRVNALKEIVQLPASSLEKAEALEQLRWMDYGYSIKVVESEGTGIAIDTPEDLEKARKQANERHAN